MTIPDAIKHPILRSFHIHTVTPGWNYDGCSPNENDRQLLVEYDVVVEEVNLLSPEYVFFPSACHYQNFNFSSGTSLSSSTLTKKWKPAWQTTAHKANHHRVHLPLQHLRIRPLLPLRRRPRWRRPFPHLLSLKKGSPLARLPTPTLNSMGLLFQKPNIIWDFREDVNQQRYFWPRDILGKELYGLKEMKDLNEPAALK